MDGSVGYALLVVEFLKRLFGRKEELAPVALVLLETEPRVLSAGHVAMAVSQALGRPFNEQEVREERTSYHRLIVEGYELTVMSSPKPYLPKEGDGRDMRLQIAINRHEAAVLIDCWAAPEGHEREEATGLMGKIIAELHDDSSLAVYCFHTQRLNLIDGNLLPMLREGRALEAMQTMTFEPVDGVSAGDERMQAAIEEARRRWPEVVTAFAERGAGDYRFLVKAPFGPDDRIEHMWIDPERIDESGATGILMNEPLALARPRKGDRVTVEASHISDWKYGNGETIVGDFTLAALEPR